MLSRQFFQGDTETRCAVTPRPGQPLMHCDDVGEVRPGGVFWQPLDNAPRFLFDGGFGHAVMIAKPVAARAGAAAPYRASRPSAKAARSTLG